MVEELVLILGVQRNSQLGKASMLYLRVRSVCSQCPVETGLPLDSIDTMGGIEILDQCNLETCRTALAGHNGRRSQKELPNAVPTFAVLCLHLLTIGKPVSVPTPQGCGVVNANGIDILDLKSDSLQAVNNKTQRSRCISSRKDVFVHEEPPDQILILPRFAKARVLQDQDSVVVQKVVQKTQEAGKIPNADVLTHFEANNLLVAAAICVTRDIAVVHTKDAGLTFRDGRFTQYVVAPRCLITAKGDTSNMGAVFLRCESGEGSPSTAHVEHCVTLFQLNLFANDGKLVVLKLLKRLFSINVRHDTGGVNHTWPEKPTVEVISSIVVAADLFLIFPMSADSSWKFDKRILPCDLV